MRILIYTGKGGTGKTTIACATALKVSEMGLKTIIISTDAAHSVSDSLAMHVKGEVTHIRKNLDALEIDVPTELERYWGEVYEYFVSFLSHYGIERLTAKEIAILPGMDLVAALFHIDEFAQEGKYDCIVVDTAPTADTLRLLSLPDVLNWYFEKIFKIQRRFVKVAKVTVGRLMRTPLPGDAVFQQAEGIYLKLSNAKKVLNDPKTTSVRLVLNPERMVINETRRAFTFLSMYGFTVDALVLNKVMPSEAKGYFTPALNEQALRLQEIEESFPSIPILRVPRFEREVVGIEMLERLADGLYEDDDPMRPLSLRPALTFSSKGKYEVVSILLPFVKEKELELHTKDDTLFIRVGGFKRNIMLPTSLIGAKVVEGEIVGDTLHIKFKGKENAKTKDR